MKKIVLVLSLTIGTLVGKSNPIKNEYMGRDGVWHVIYDSSKISNVAKEAIKIQKQRLNWNMIDVEDYENYVRMFINAKTPDEIFQLASIIKK